MSVAYHLFTETCRLEYIEKRTILPSLPKTLQRYLLENMQSRGLITISEDRPLSKYPINQLDSDGINNLIKTAPKDAYWVEIKPTQKARDIYSHGVLQDTIDTCNSILRTLDEWAKE